MYLPRGAHGLCFVSRPIGLPSIHRNSEIRAIQVNHLLGVWLYGDEKESKAVREGLDEKINAYAAGELEHAVDAMLSIWETSNKEGPAPSIPAAPSTSSLTLPRPSSGLVRPQFYGYNMRTPLIKSIQEGSLLDRKYWARQSREGKIVPVYFPRLVSETKLKSRESPRFRVNVRY